MGDVAATTDHGFAINFSTSALVNGITFICSKEYVDN